MKTNALLKIRLSWYFVFFFVLYSVICLLLPRHKFDSGALALFSVNSFLYGFYIAPILGAQKARVEELHRIVRAESSAIFAMVIQLKQLPTKLRNDLQAMFTAYLKASIKEKRPAEGEVLYEALITFCLSYKGKHQTEISKLLDGLVANEQ